jgi:hypothetical protein
MKSDALSRIVRPRQRFGYDLVVYVGLARYLRRKQREEIRAELFRKRGITLSAGSVSNLCDRFLLYLEALHLVRSPDLKAAMQEYGYPLHIDATSEYGKGGLFVCMDGFRKWVLCAGKIESESEEHLKPFVERTVELFGAPIATVRDLGPPGKNAVAHLVERGVPDFVCHYHFLGAVGEKLFDKPYAFLRNLLRQSQVRSDLRQLLKEMKRYRVKDQKKGRFGPGRIREDLLALVHWVVEGEGKKDAMYPFSLPHLEFFQRCRAAMQRVDTWVPTPRSQAERRALRHLESITGRPEKDERFKDAVGRLEKGWQAFTQTRNTLRLTDAELPRGDNRYQQINLPAPTTNTRLNFLGIRWSATTTARLSPWLNEQTMWTSIFLATKNNSSAAASGGLTSVEILKINPLKLPLPLTYVTPITFASSADPWTISTMPSPI